MSLRGRVLAATMLAALLALGVVDVVTYLFVERAQIDQVDRELERAHQPIEDAAASVDDDDDAAAAAVRAVAPASYVELRSTEGETELMLPLTRAGSPTIDLRHVELSPGTGGEDAAAFRTVEFGGEENDVRVRVSRQDDGSTLIIGQSLGLVERTRERLTAFLALGTIGALLVVALVGGWLVGIGLAPLDEVERAMADVAEGDLDRRAPGASEETEVGRLADTVNLMLDQLVGSIRSREADLAALEASEGRLHRFVADASHELRTPINATAAFAEGFDGDAPTRPEDLERARTGIRAETARMNRLVDDLVLLTELDDGRPIARQPVDLADLADATVRAAQAAAPDRHVGLRISDHVSIVGDADRLQQALERLIGNVRVHTPPGTSCLVDLRREGDEAVMSVIDDGPGIDAARLVSITDRLVPADPSPAGQAAATGLGLVIVSSIVEAHGGTLGFENPPEGGLQVSVRLPVASAAPEAAGTDAGPADAGSDPS